MTASNLGAAMKIQHQNTGQFLANDCGATSLEWALALGALTVPLYLVIQIALAFLVDLYRSQMIVNGLPLP